MLFRSEETLWSRAALSLGGATSSSQDSKFTTTNDGGASSYSSTSDNIVKQPHCNKHDVQASCSSSVAVGDTFESHSHREPHHLRVARQREGLQHIQEVDLFVSSPVNNHYLLQQPQYPLAEPSLGSRANCQAVNAFNSNASIPDWRFVNNYANPWIPTYLGTVGPALIPNTPAISTAAPMIPGLPIPQFPSIPSQGAFFPPQAPLGITYRTPCTFCMATFTRPYDLERHVQSIHLDIRHHCTWLGCTNNKGKGYCRIEKLRKHQRDNHGYAIV